MIAADIKSNVVTADGLTKHFIFIFWIDDDDMSAKHEGAHNFDFDGVGFAGPGSGENEHVGVFHREAIKNDE